MRSSLFLVVAAVIVLALAWRVGVPGTNGSNGDALATAEARIRTLEARLSTLESSTVRLKAGSENPLARHDVTLYCDITEAPAGTAFINSGNMDYELDCNQ